jgi:hypothetical protein
MVIRGTELILEGWGVDHRLASRSDWRCLVLNARNAVAAARRHLIVVVALVVYS